MRSILIILFLLVSVSVSASEYRYYTHGWRPKKWYFGDPGYYKEVVGYDSLTFRVIRPENWNSDSDFHFAIDKNYVYCQGKRIEGADPETFELMTEGCLYSKDNKNVYFATGKVDEADLKTFECIPKIYTPGCGYGGVYAKDKNSVFEIGRPKSYDVSTFKLLSWGFVTDKSGIYHNDILLKGSSSANYRAMDVYMVSNNKVYYQYIEIEGADANSFQMIIHRENNEAYGGGLDYTIAKDKNCIYIDAEVFRQFDVKTFEIVTSPILPPEYEYNMEEEKWTDINAVVVKDKNGIYRIERDGIEYLGGSVSGYIEHQFNIIPEKVE